jgi:hypothetical protein
MQLRECWGGLKREPFSARKRLATHLSLLFRSTFTTSDQTGHQH